MNKKFLLWLVLLCVVLMIWEAVDWKHAAESAEIEKIDFKNLVTQELSEEDYSLIFSQTGLGKPAVDSLRESGKNFPGELEKFQEQFVKPLTFRRGFICFPFTTAEILVDEAGHSRKLMLPPVKTGDILITKSTKTALYRHGHAAICLDGETGSVAEAMALGRPSQVSSLDSFCSYATLLILRPKIEKETIDRVVEFTKEKLLHVPYSPLAGFLKKDKQEMYHIDTTYCSHLVWQAYRTAEIDLDPDGGWLASPHDLSCSEELEIVFAFGFGQKNILWFPYS